MKLTEEKAREIREMATRPDDAVYLEELLEEAKGSSKIAAWALCISILSLVVAVIAVIIPLCK